MSSEHTDHDQVFAEPYPRFLELLKTDTQAATEEFVRYARPWLLAHPTPGMRDLSPEEQHAVVEETIERCLRKEGEPLRNYTDVWGTFGDWLASVAESTCASRAGKKGQKKSVRFMDEEIEEPKKTPRPAPAPTGPAKEKPPRRQPAPPPPAWKTPPDEKPSRAVRAFLGWLRSPRVFVPILLVVIVVAIFRGTHKGPDRSPASRTNVPIDAVVMGAAEVGRASFDVLPIPSLPALEEEDAKVPVTAVFRQSRMVVLQLDVASVADDATAAAVEVRNEAGETVWNDVIDPDALGSGTLYLRIDPNTFPSGDYQVLVTDTGAQVIARSVFMVR
jgi:hypothetical protein